MTEDDYFKALHDTLDFSIYVGHNICPKHQEVEGIDYKLRTNAVALLIRALTKAHAINVLFDNDLGEEANIILRVLIEIEFVVCSIERDSEKFAEYRKDLALQKFKELRVLEKASEIPECFFDISAEQKKSISEMAKQFKGKRQLGVYDHARNAGMLALYHSSYSILCRYVHNGPAEIDEHFDIRNEVLTVKRSNKVQKDLVYFSAIEAMRNILNCIERIFATSYLKLKELNDMYESFNNILYRRYRLKENIFAESEEANI